MQFLHIALAGPLDHRTCTAGGDRFGIMKYHLCFRSKERTKRDWNAKKALGRGRPSHHFCLQFLIEAVLDLSRGRKVFGILLNRGELRLASGAVSFRNFPLVFFV